MARTAPNALLLAAIAQVMIDDGIADVGDPVREYVHGVERLGAALAPFTPEAVAGPTGVAAATIREMARELEAAPSAAVFGRIGTTTTEFGLTASWLIDVVNTLSGNLDRPGGSMFSTPVAGGATTRGRPGSGKGFTVGRGHTRVSGRPEVMGECPVGALAEEIATPGDGQLRALVTLAGNPVLSTPNSNQLADALDDHEFMVSIDLYLNEMTRYADVILPVPSQLERGHYDLLLLQFAVRNVANYSEPVLPLADGQPDEWEVISKLSLIAQGLGPDAAPAIIDDMAIDGMIASAVKDEFSNVFGREPDELRAELDASGRRGPERVIDLMLRTGPFGEGFGADADGTSLDDLLAHPHGRDFGALVPRLPEILRTPTGRVELAPDVFVDDLERLAGAIPELTRAELRARRALAPPEQQLVDAQHQRAGERASALHAAGAR